MVLLLNDETVTRTLNGSVPWSAITEYDGGRLGRVGCASSAPTVAEAIEQAKQWLRDHPPRRVDMYLRPSSVIEVGYRNLFNGENPYVR
ncbi:hypothetical protein MAL1_00206 [Bacteriophage DSS3_MAL1]|nr:hypothetical protein MAL1_00206 [Bacteriophage DSS3_MAL1]